MVEIVTGGNIGLERNSALLTGGAGAVGSGSTGNAGIDVVVNAANGNLTLQSVSETLIGNSDDGELNTDTTTLSAIVNQTYNSLGLLKGTNTNNAWQNQGAQIIALTGTLNTAGSTVQRVGWDGSIVTYAWSASYLNNNGTTGAYIAKEDSGPDDSLAFNVATDQWAWHDGASNVTEFYGQLTTGGRYYVVSRTDLHGNTETFTYSGALLTQITTADGEYVSLSYSGNNLTQLTTHLASGATLTRTYYAYDSQNRLTTVTTDLSPNDNAISDGNTYTTSYSYVGTSKLVASLKQSDGSEIDFTYDSSNRVSSYTQWVSSTVSRTTTLTYNAGSTTITDPLGNQTVMSYNASGLLTGIAYPAVAGGVATYRAFTYDANGDVLTDATYANVNNAPSGSPITQVTNTYDQNGNLLSTADLAGDLTTYTYNQFNEVTAKTVYTGAGASGAETTYYVYNSQGSLVYTINPAGNVTFNVVNAKGQVTSTFDYPASSFSLSGYSPTSLPTAAALASWQAGLTAAQNQTIERTDYTYDLRGNLATATTYSATDGNGNGLTTSPYTQTTYVYDQAGELLSKVTKDQAGNTTASEAYVYDGLGRITLATDGVGKQTATVYNNAANTATITYANGLTEVEQYDRADELVSSTDTGSGIATTTNSYIYDAEGNLRVATNPAGLNTYYFYDAEGRKTGMVDTDGYLTEYKYDGASRLTATVTYYTQLNAAQLATLAPSGSTPSATTLTAIQPLANANDNWNWTVYNAAGEVAETITAVGTVTAYTYDGTGATTSTTTYANQLSAAQLASFMTTPPTSTALPAASSLDRTVRDFYDADGRLIGTLDPQGYLTQVDYDSAGRKVDTVAYATQVSSSLWAAGTFAQLQASVGTNTHDEHSYFLYDNRGLLMASIDPVGDVTRFAYTASGQIASETTSSGQVTPNTAYTLATLPAASGTIETTAFTYDADGRVLSKTLGQGSSAQATTSYTYDAAGNVLSVTDARGFTDSSTYDVLGRVLTTSVAIDGTTADNLVTHYTYDARGLKISETDARSQTTYFYYDSDNRLAITVDPDGYATNTWYYANTNEIAGVRRFVTPLAAGTYSAGYAWPSLTSNANDTITTFGYDAAGRLISTTDANGNSEWYALDAFGDRVQVTNKLGGVTTYAYNQRGLLTSETIGETSSLSSGAAEAASVTNTYSYDAFGNRTQMVEASGLAEARTTTYAYDNLNRLTAQSQTVFTNNTTGTATTAYQYDGNGNIILTTDPNGNKTYAYYDALNRKVAVVNALGVLSTNTYDGDGNVTSTATYATPLAAGSYSAGGATPVGSGAYRQVNSVYDGAGRLFYTYVPNVLTGYWNGSNYVSTTGNVIIGQNVYDADGNVIKVVDADGHATTYTYDAAGYKIAQVDGDGYLTTYVNDANGNVLTEHQYAAAQAYSTSPNSNANDRITTFTYDKNGNRLTETRQNVAYVTTSGDSISQLSGNATITYTYNALGEVLSKTEATGDATNYTYDNQGRLTQTVNATGETTLNYYDGLNNVTRTQTSGASSATRVTTYTYGAGGRLVSTSGPGINAAETMQYSAYVYDLAGDTLNRYTSTANGSFSTWINYDALNRAINEQSWYWNGSTWIGNDVLGTQYDAFGDITAQTVNGTVTTRTVYDATGHIIASNAGDGTWKAYINDAQGNATLTIQSIGTTDLSSLLSVSSTNGVDTSTYNQAGALAWAISGGIPTSANGVEATFAWFDGRNQQSNAFQTLRQIDSSGNLYTLSTAVNYDAFGDVGNQVDARGYWTSYTYNTEGKITSQVSPQVNIASGNGATSTGNPTTYDYYDLSGRVVATRDADGNLITRSLLAGTGYDGTQALETAEYHPDGGVTYTSYDVYGDALTQTDALGRTTTNTYDNSGNLIQVNHPVISTIAITTTSGSTSISFTGGALWVGEAISGNGIPAGTSVLSISGGTAVLSAAATASGSFSINTQLIDYYSYDAKGEQVSQSNNVQVNANASSTVFQIMPANTTLTSGQSVWSPDHRFQLVYQSDGNLVLYGPSGAIWASNTSGKTVGKAAMQGDGNLVVYNASGASVWASNTSGNPGASLYVTDTGTLVIDSSAGTPLWYGTISYLAASPFGQGYTPAVATTTYDGQGRVISTTDFAGHTVNTSYAWNGAQATNGLATYGGWTKTVKDVDAGTTATDTTDAFGHEIAKTDEGGHVYTFTFNKAGELIGQSNTTTTQSVTTNGTASSISTGGESLAYTYYNTGKVATITDTSGTVSTYYTTSLTSKFTYDADGNRLTSNYTSAYLYYVNYSGYVYSGSGSSVLENATATYDALGRIIQIVDSGTTAPSYTQTKSYDANGNIIENKTVHQNLTTAQALSTNTTDDFWYAYDSMNRTTISQGELSGTAGAAGTTVVTGTTGNTADANIAARTSQTAGVAITYDAAGERKTTTTSSMSVGSYGSITTTTTTAATESYNYTADGELANSNVGSTVTSVTSVAGATTSTTTTNNKSALEASDTRDALGRVLLQNEYETPSTGTSTGVAAGTTVYSHAYSYNADSQITADTVSTIQYNSSSGAITNSVTNTIYNYGAAVGSGTRSAASYTDGNVISQTATSTTFTGATGTSGASSTTVTASNAYLLFDSAVQASITSTYSGAQSGTTTSTFDYDHNGNVSEVVTTGTNAHTNTYTTSAAGYVMENQEEVSGSTSAPETFYFYFNNQLVGQIGNNGTTNTNYATSINNQTTTNTGTGPFQANGTTGTASANFDENYQAVNATGNGQATTGSTYTVQAGDTLQSIARAAYGDANLWYLIGQANGLSLGTPLNTGATLTIPNNVSNPGNTSSTYKPYNASAALGDVQPGAPIPPAQSDGGGCGAFGAILLAVIAIAVTAIVAPELTGEVVANTATATYTVGGVAFATSATSAIGVGGLVGTLGVTAGTIVGGAVAAAVGSAVSQGIGVAAGIQSSFSLAGVAEAALSGGISAGVADVPGLSGGSGVVGVEQAVARGAISNALTQGIGVATGLQSSFDFASVAASAAGAGLGADVGGSSFGKSLGQFGDSLVSGGAGAIASAATRSVLTGTDFGTNLLATLPQSIANTIGNEVASSIDSGDQANDTQNGGSGQANIGPLNLPPSAIDNTLTTLDASIDAAAGGGAVNPYLVGYNSNVDYALIGANPMNVPFGISNEKVYVLNAILNPQGAGTYLQSDLARAYFSGASNWASTDFELAQRWDNYHSLVQAAGENPTATQLADITNLKAALDANGVRLAAVDKFTDQMAFDNLVKPALIAGGAGAGAAAIPILADAAATWATTGTYAEGAPDLFVRGSINGLGNAGLNWALNSATGQGYSGKNGTIDTVVGFALGTIPPGSTIAVRELEFPIGTVNNPAIGIPIGAGTSEIIDQITGRTPSNYDPGRVVIKAGSGGLLPYEPVVPRF